jgi:hypothetical protein
MTDHRHLIRWRHLGRGAGRVRSTITLMVTVTVIGEERFAAGRRGEGGRGRSGRSEGSGGRSRWTRRRPGRRSTRPGTVPG